MKILHHNSEWPWPKHEGKATFNVIIDDAAHVLWMIENVFPKQNYTLSPSLQQALRVELEKRDTKAARELAAKTFDLPAEKPAQTVTQKSKAVHKPIKGRIFTTDNQIDYVRSKKLPGKAYSVSGRQKKQRA